MANYKETSLTGAEWTRCCEIRIANPYNATPVITFVEQRVADLAGKVFTERGEHIIATFDPATTVAVLDTTTGADTGTTVTYNEIYQMLYSAYMAQAQARDAGV